MKKKNETVVTLTVNGKNVEVEESQVLKYEIAEEIGVIDKVLESGWRGLTAKETGKIGGIMARRREKEKQNSKDDVS